MFKINSTKTFEYFTTKSESTGPVDDDLTGAILVINYEASLDTTINVRTVYNALNFISDVGGFVVFLLMITYTFATVWNFAFLKAFLVSRIFEK